MDRKMILIFAVGMLFFLLVPVNAIENTCVDCHKGLEPYNATEKKFNEIRLKHLERGVACSLECHADTITKIAKSNYEQWTKSKHALFNVTCDNCHGGNPSTTDKETAHTGIGTAEDPKSPVYYRNVPDTCGKCHSKELEQFKGSLHYQKLEALEQAPTCTTCHNPHIFKVLEPSQLQSTCKNCHSAEAGIAPSDIPLKARADLESFGRLKSKIFRVEEAINKAKAEGRQIPPTATTKLENAKKIMKQIPVVWHRFDLPIFEGTINEAVKEAQAAEDEITSAGITVQKETTKPGETQKPEESPSTGILTAVSVMIIALLARKRK